MEGMHRNLNEGLFEYALHEETPLPEGNYEDGSLCLDEEALEIFEDTSELKRGG